ncbi:S-layer homology domain-containing protein [Paenibacillus turpanensis]|uniref:S-layer homology domain-containing protein n=1 Tax=Paenibacillus turpanensis TaxID=2689078 RepID=UPI001FB58442|nr:S-layer homology domain-containing protein [Paenibacillus turpanensis]
MSMWNNGKAWAKKVTISSVALAMILGGATSALADGKGRGKDKDDDKYEGRGKGKIELKIEFKDVEEQYAWALQHIASLSARGVFKGYEDGSFQPEKSISRIEALTAAVRLMGLESQAQAKMNTELNFSDANNIPSWATGYVATALENDLFLETDSAVQPNKAANRLWATTLLVKALKLEDEAKAKMNTKLSFKDAKEIPAASVGYVAVAIEKGLVNGYENNTFRPNQPVTRAELAVLLNRTGNQMPTQDAQTVRGEVTAVAANSITVKKDSVASTYAVNSDVFVYRNGAKTTLSAVQQGDTVLLRTYDNAVVFIEVTQLASTNVPFALNAYYQGATLNNSGKMTSITVSQQVYNGTQLMIYNVSENLAIEGNAALLLPNSNQLVEISGKNQIVEKIVIK